jgi:hypothetical protein
VAPRAWEIVIVLAGAVLTTVAFAVVKISWAVEPALFLAGVGIGTIVEFVIQEQGAERCAPKVQTSYSKTRGF